MKKSLGYELIIYGVLLLGLTTVAHQVIAAVPRAAWLAAVLGGLLSLLWGGWAVLGRGSKALALLTLVGVSFVLLSQAVLNWTGPGDGVAGSRAVAGVMTLLLVMSVGMLMRIAYAGMLPVASPPTPSSGRPTDPARKERPTMAVAAETRH